MAQRKGVIRRAREMAALAALGALLLVPTAALTAEMQILSADQAVKIALERNPTVLQAAQEVRAASGQFLSSRAAILPQVSLGADYRNTLKRSTAFTRTGVQQGTDFWSGSAGVSQTLVSFPEWGRIRSSASSRTASIEASRGTRADIALAAYRQYYALLKAYKLASVRTLSLQLRNDQLKRTQALFELGSVARGDVLKQQVQVSQALFDQIAAQKDILVQRAQLGAVLGLDVGQRVDIDTTLAEPSFEVDSVAVLRDALARRPELAAYRARVQAARAGLGAAKGSRYPSLVGGLSYSFTTPGFPKTWEQIDSRASWNASVSLNIPVFDGFAAKGSIRQARAGKLQAEYALREQELGVVVEVEQALQAAIQSREQIRVARDGLSAAEEDLKLTQEKYNVGSATVIELIDSQVAMVTAAVQFIGAMADAHVAEMQLKRARGETF